MTKFGLGIEFIDEIGVQPGFVIFIEEVGAGGREFALNVLMKNAERDIGVYYLSLSKTEKEVLRDLKMTFPLANLTHLLERVSIVSLSFSYFRRSIIPAKWIDVQADLNELRFEKNILLEIVKFFESVNRKSIVFLDSLTDLTRFTQRNIEWVDIIDLLKGLRKLCIKNDVLAIAMMTSKVLDVGKEEEILEQADGVVVFEWKIEKEILSRWMYFRKFLGIMPFIERERIAKYNIRLDPSGVILSKMVKVV